MRWGFLQQKLFCLHFFHVLFDCNLFEINISYGFVDNKLPTAFGAVDRNLKCQLFIQMTKLRNQHCKCLNNTYYHSTCYGRSLHILQSLSWQQSGKNYKSFVSKMFIMHFSFFPLRLPFSTPYLFFYYQNCPSQARSVNKSDVIVYGLQH